ncbi:hypothetical protein Ahy_A05g022951 isoform B [Arachis hypogaea]|uniref:Aminotransferase-like plant mobile domain-containing protein n=1 Tax=Arachis hypogaea TaxID=3818 RepID=A0A445D1X9_ARAHY|nr:hypothetical protein Ahy_A05g022951 isoform B [Arachis hypogaea]
MSLWRVATTLIYFAVIEWHSVDRVLSLFGGIQGRPRATLNIDFLMSKDGRVGDREQHVLQVDVVADLGSSHEYLDWWYQFLPFELFLGDPKAAAISAQAIQRGLGRVPDMDQVSDVPDNRRVARRQRVGT